MRCVMCQFFLRRLERANRAWEMAHSGDERVWDLESALNLSRLEEANALFDVDPENTVSIYEDAARDGSALAANLLGFCHSNGIGTAQDEEVAREYYLKAYRRGMRMAMIYYASLSYDTGDQTHIELYREGVADGFLPANYWLAAHRYARSPTRRTARKIAPLLDPAAAAGHPKARVMQFQLRIRGKYGASGFFEALKSFPMVWREV